jgi:hypothetical protein
VKIKFEKSFSSTDQVLIYRQAEINGLEVLEQLGASLYEKA